MSADYTVEGRWSRESPFREYIEVLAATFAEGVISRHLHWQDVDIRITATKRVIGGCECGGYCDHLDPARGS